MEEGGRFRSSTKDEWERCVLDAVPANTRRATDTWVKALQAYNSSINLKTCSAEDLAAVLEGFYFDLKKKDGSLYKSEQATWRLQYTHCQLEQALLE